MLLLLLLAYGPPLLPGDQVLRTPLVTTTSDDGERPTVAVTA